MIREKLVIVSPAWPGEDSGYAIANASSLYTLKKGASEVIYFGITEKPYSGHPVENVNFIHLPTGRHSKAARFLSSMLSSFPAVCQKYNGRKKTKSIDEILSKKGWLEEQMTIVFEDIPVTCLLEQIHRSFPAAELIIRSHNVLSEAFEGFAKNNRSLSGLLWSYEVRRIKKLEQSLLRSETPFYAISNRDGEEYQLRFGASVDGVIGITLDRDKLEKIQPGDQENGDHFTIIHLGSLDLRKAHGMRNFIDHTFLKARAEFPQLKLVLGGRNSEAFHQPENNIFGEGFVDSEEEFMNRGAIFVNPQLRGTGVKLKSLMAMGAGKILLTTAKGVEGIECINGTHCLIYEDPQGAYELIRALIQNPLEFSSISRQASEFVLEKYAAQRK